MNKTNQPKPAIISDSAKKLFCFGAWGVVVIISAIPHPSQLFLAPFFPIGLLALFSGGEMNVIVAWMLILPALFGWVFYAFYQWVLLKVRRANVFWSLYFIFCLLLLLNIAGCKSTLKAVAGIH